MGNASSNNASNKSTKDQPNSRGSHNHGDDRPVAGYAVLMATYAVLSAIGVVLSREHGGLRRLPLNRLFLYAIATEHLSRTLAKDSITSFIRKPFTLFIEATGEGEVNEEVVGTGLRHAIGDLVTCPFCLAQWVGTALIIGSNVAPEFTDAAVDVSVLARTSDYLQLAYDHFKNNA